MCGFCFFKHKTSYEMRISDWSSDVCSSDLRVQLQQVLLNLIVNACEAMRETPPAERVLSVSSREGRGREVELLLADRGQGIAREIADQLFDPFAMTKKEGLGDRKSDVYRTRVAGRGALGGSRVIKKKQ